MQSTSEMHTYADMWGDIRGRCIYPNERRRVYFNRGAGARPQFVDVAERVGLVAGDNSRGVSLVDLDNDGRLDVVIANQHGGPSIFHNAATSVSSSNRWVGVRLVGNGRSCTRDALGSTITVLTNDGRKQMREVQAQNGFASQHDPRVHFGLGAHPGGSVIVNVRWCGGAEKRYRLPINRYHRIEQ
jgi:hypothetical protein